MLACILLIITRAEFVECDEATTVPMHHETVPGPVECDDAMTALVDHDAVFALGAQSNATSRAPANRGLAGLSDGGLTVLGSNASRRFGAFRSSARRLSVVVGSQRWPEDCLAALGQTDGLAMTCRMLL
jgi:hypothetical protein